MIMKALIHNKALYRYSAPMTNEQISQDHGHQTEIQKKKSSYNYVYSAFGIGALF